MEVRQTTTVTGISDVSTGLYNYGYRDYKPTAARFTTVDPIRDGSNWFAYVNNDPVNYLDLWGLCASDNNQNVNSFLSFIGQVVDIVVDTAIDIAGKYWASPMTGLGIVVGGVMTGVSYLFLGNDVKIEPANNAISFNN